MTVPRRAALDLLRSLSADTVPHLNGTLLDHLVATEEILRTFGAREDLCRAGLCHAAYGTDGFAPFLLALDDRDVLRAAAGDSAERIVYVYASCRRALLYPRLAAPGPVTFPDRFTDTTWVASDADLSDFVDLTLANELDIALHGGTPVGLPPWIGPLVDQIEHRASPGARRGARSLLAAA
jgi:hypothetical protein